MQVDLGLIPGLVRFPGGRAGNPLQYSCLENPMDRGAWRATIHEEVKSRTWLSNSARTQHTHKYYTYCALHFCDYSQQLPLR